MLKVDDRVVVADSRLDQTLCVPRRRRAYQFQSRGMKERRLRHLGVEGPAAHVTSRRAAHYNRRGEARPVPSGGNIIGQHIVRARDEINELHLGDRAHAHMCRPSSCAHDRSLAYRCIDNAVRPEPLKKTLRDLESSTVLGDIFTQQKNPLIPLQFLPHSLAQGLQVSDFSHPAPRTTACHFRSFR